MVPKHNITFFGLSIFLGVIILNSPSSTFFAERARGLRKKKKKKPKSLNYIIAGFPHCGSSSMTNLLQSHDETSIVNDGETQDIN